jgi:DNA-binding NarL/FixJ family response regulator
MSLFTRRVLLVDDDRLLCSSLAQALTGYGFDPLCAFSAKEAKKQLVAFDPDVVICDIDLGSGPTGIDLINVLRRQRPTVVAMLLSKHPDSVSAGYTTSDIPDGVAYLRKSLVHDTKALVEAIDQAAKEHAAPLRHDKTPSSILDSLTRTQRDVLRLMALGLSNQEISKQRGVSLSAVEQRITEINRQLGITPDGTTVPRVLAIREYITAAGVPKRS